MVEPPIEKGRTSRTGSGYQRFVNVSSGRPNPPPLAVVRRLTSTRDDAALVAALRQGAEWARAELFDRFGPEVEQVIRRVLGYERHTEFADVVHDAFVEALTGIERLRDPSALGAWMRSVAAHTAYKTVRSRSRRRWLRFVAPEDLPEPTDHPDPDGREACIHTYRVLDRMRAGDRIVFALRYIDGRELGEVAAMCGTSLSTAKRRLTRAEERFLCAARRDPVLRRCLEEGSRWNP